MIKLIEQFDVILEDKRDIRTWKISVMNRYLIFVVIFFYNCTDRPLNCMKCGPRMCGWYPGVKCRVLEFFEAYNLYYETLDVGVSVDMGSNGCMLDCSSCCCFFLASIFYALGLASAMYGGSSSYHFV